MRASVGKSWSSFKDSSFLVTDKIDFPAPLVVRYRFLDDLPRGNEVLEREANEGARVYIVIQVGAIERKALREERVQEILGVVVRVRPILDGDRVAIRKETFRLVPWRQAVEVSAKHVHSVAAEYVDLRPVVLQVLQKADVQRLPWITRFRRDDRGEVATLRRGRLA
jgi:hypothetical protein